jgi:hypothetical protein
MTSIIKVDQIQNAAGGVPTAGDLGLNVTGTIIQAKDLQFSNQSTVSTTTETFITGSSISFTPKSTNSRILVDMKIACNVNSNTVSAGGVYHLYKDSVKVTSYPAYNVYASHANTTTTDMYGPYASQHAYDNTSLSQVTFTLYGRLYQSSMNRFAVNLGGSTSSITIYEIAG